MEFTDKERQNYIRQSNKCIFKTPEEEYLYANENYKKCSKCNLNKNLNNFNGNTSGTDAFDKNGYRLRRPECLECGKNINKGKYIAKKQAKEQGISHKAPEGTLCEICNKPSTIRNKIVFDHCHLTNKFRGYTCNSCNKSLGVFGDNIDGLLKVMNYLLKFEECKIIQEEDGSLSKYEI